MHARSLVHPGSGAPLEPAGRIKTGVQTVVVRDESEHLLAVALGVGPVGRPGALSHQREVDQHRSMPLEQFDGEATILTGLSGREAPDGFEGIAADSRASRRIRSEEHRPVKMFRTRSSARMTLGSTGPSQAYR